MGISEQTACAPHSPRATRVHIVRGLFVHFVVKDLCTEEHNSAREPNVRAFGGETSGVGTSPLLNGKKKIVLKKTYAVRGGLARTRVFRRFVWSGPRKTSPPTYKRQNSLVGVAEQRGGVVLCDSKLVISGAASDRFVEKKGSRSIGKNHLARVLDDDDNACPPLTANRVAGFSLWLSSCMSVKFGAPHRSR